MKNFSKSSILAIVVSFLFAMGPLATFAAGPATINLGSLTTNNFVIFGQTGVTDANPTISSITGNVGTSLVASPAVTGLSCTEVTGKIYTLTTAGYAGGHDSNVGCYLQDNIIVPAAVGDFTTAYNNAIAAKIPTVSELGSGTLNTQTLVPGTYDWSTNVTITGDITLSGGPDDIWIFQLKTTKNLIIQSGKKILLTGGAQAKNVFWAVSGYTEIFDGATFEGNILGWGYIAMDAGAILHGRALSQTQVTLIGNTISAPTTAAPVVTQRRRVSQVVPIIDLVKVPSPLALTSGQGPVTYNYTVKNIGGQQALIDITLVDDKCSPIVLSSGDLNNDGKLDANESWQYTCTATLKQTTTNTAIATGHSSDGYYNTAIDTAIATVVVSTPAQPTVVQPPLINIVKVPNQLTPFPYGGGNVTYTYTVTNPGIVAMSNVKVTDDKCPTVSFVSGDNNGNNLLDTNESWIYSCKTSVTVSTGSVATAKGDANGFTAVAYAFTNVLVSVPELPNTGLASETNNTSWITIILSGIIVLLSISLVVVSRKNKI